MIQFEVLRPPEATPLVVESESADEGLELPLSVPMTYAEVAQDGDIMLWLDVERHVTGLFQARNRAAWQRARLEGLHLVTLKPGDGPGVVGLELVLSGGEERPILASTAYDEELVGWFRARDSVWKEYLGYKPDLVDYGKDG